MGKECQPHFAFMKSKLLYKCATKKSCLFVCFFRKAFTMGIHKDIKIPISRKEELFRWELRGDVLNVHSVTKTVGVY